MIDSSIWLPIWEAGNRSGPDSQGRTLTSGLFHDPALSCVLPIFTADQCGEIFNVDNKCSALRLTMSILSTVPNPW